MRSILADECGMDPAEIDDGQPLAVLLSRGPANQGLQPAELTLFLISMRLEDQLGIDLTEHREFDRLLAGNVAKLIGAAESLQAGYDHRTA